MTLHRLSLKSEGESPLVTEVQLDGKPLSCSRIELILDANSRANYAVLTVPVVLLDIDIPTDIVVIDPTAELAHD